MVRYGTLAERYVRAFDTKWPDGGATGDEQLVGSADIQSLADLSNSVEVVRTMRVLSVTRDAIMRLVVTTLAPVASPALTMMPLEEPRKLLFGVLFYSRCSKSISPGSPGTSGGNRSTHDRHRVRPDSAGQEKRAELLGFRV